MADRTPLRNHLSAADFTRTVVDERVEIVQELDAYGGAVFIIQPVEPEPESETDVETETEE